MLVGSKIDPRCRKCRSNHSRAYHCDGTGESRLQAEGRKWCAAFDPMPKRRELEKLNWRV